MSGHGWWDPVPRCSRCNAPNAVHTVWDGRMKHDVPFCEYCARIRMRTRKRRARRKAA